MSFIGPALPQHLAKPSLPAEEEDESEQEAYYGPPLPPGLKSKSDDMSQISRTELKDQEPESEVDEDDPHLIGPLPPSSSTNASSCSIQDSIAQQIEARSKKTKDKILGHDKEAPKRDSWMLELPQNSKAFGMGPRQFSKSSNTLSAKDKDRTEWTKIQGKETSESLKEKDGYDKECLEYLASLQKDTNMEKISNELTQKRGSESLMDIHKNKLSKLEDDSSKDSSRRPFDRDLDLQANKFDNAVKDRLIKQSRNLNDKFSHGKSKFL
uniref:KIAA1704 ortholog [Odobenus rosmarus divergens] n=1 Tax=Lepeophtheirus salmonis TaxID=72036 RepID=A0A0K2USZ4_LEPSM